MKLIYCFALLFLPLITIGQTAKGTWVLGASIFTSNMSNQSREIQTAITTHQTSKSYGATVNPSLGTFVADNLSIGIAPALSFVHSTTDYEDLGQKSRSDVRTISIGPYIEYFFGKNPKAKPFAQLTASWGMGKKELKTNLATADYSYSYKADTNVRDVLAQAGYAIFLNESIRLKIFVGYRHTVVKDDGKQVVTGDTTTNIKDTSIDNSFFFGAGISTVLKRK